MIDERKWRLAMDRRLEELKAWGCTVDATMERFLNDEEFYFECYEQLMEDPGFMGIKEALEVHDIKKAFEYAHSLKGIIGNLGLTSIYDIMVDLVEILRTGSEEGAQERYQELMQERKQYEKLIKNADIKE